MNRLNRSDLHQPARDPQPAKPSDSLRQSPSPGTDIYTCWSEIGVYGRGTCVELTKFIHCRNCPVYSNAGVQLLDRALPPDYRREATEHFASEKRRAAPSKLSAVLFRIGSEWLALPTQAFQEVAEQRVIHSLPHRRQGIVLGLVNVRGELLTCVSLGRMLGLENIPPAETLRITQHRLMVIHWDGQRFAFPVQEVQGIHRLQPHEIKPPPATITKSTPNHTQGVFPWRDHAVGFLEADSLFSALNRSLS